MPYMNDAGTGEVLTASLDRVEELSQRGAELSGMSFALG